MTAVQGKKGRAGGTAGSAHPVDVHVGGRVRLRRTMLRMSQEELAYALGLSFQQIQKYEGGVNRISASRLHQLSRILNVPVSFFFDDLEMSRPAAAQFAAAQGRFKHDPMAKRETLELVRAYYRIPEQRVRKRIFEMVKAIATAVTRPDQS